MKLCHKQWWPGNGHHQSARSVLVKVPANDYLMGPQCWGRQSSRLSSFNLFSNCLENLNMFKGWEKKERREQRKRMSTMSLTFRKLSQRSGSALHICSLLGKWGWGWLSIQTLRKYDAWLTLQMPIQHVVGLKTGAGWGNFLLASLPVVEMLSQLCNEYSQEHSLGTNPCSWMPSLCWVLKGHQKCTSVHMSYDSCPPVDSRLLGGGGPSWKVW